MTVKSTLQMCLPLLRAAAAASAAVLVASCGGGTSQIEPFRPTRYIAFGDEMSAFTTDGRKYAFNGLDSAGVAIDCKVNALWIQTVASLYQFNFAECPAGTVDAKAITRAAPNARAAEVKLQIDQQEQLGFTDKDLVTILVGINDVKEIYENRAGAAGEEALIQQARSRGVDVATQVNRVVALGAKVVVSTAPDVGLSPYGLAKGAADAALLSRLSAALNGQIRVNILNDGRFVGLVLADEFVQTAVRFPSVYGLADGDAVTKAACNVALPNCTRNTVVTGANADTWLWAGDLWLGTVAHRQLGAQAATRAINNPF